MHLMQEGLECFRIQVPKGMDANEYALKVQPPAKSLGLLVRKALWLGKGQGPQCDVAAEPAAGAVASRGAGRPHRSGGGLPSPKANRPPPRGARCRP